MGHGTMVITVLLGAIILCVFGLLVSSFHNPKDMIAQEVGTVERLEGVLRQMLSDQPWPAGARNAEGGDSDQTALLREQVAMLEKELSEKQQQLEAGGTGGAALPPDVEALKSEIKDLKEKLQEYSVIEEDIADLSKFRQENEELRKKITEVSGIGAQEAITMPWDEFEKIVKDKKVVAAKDTVTTTIENKEG